MHDIDFVGLYLNLEKVFPFVRFILFFQIQDWKQALVLTKQTFLPTKP